MGGGAGRWLCDGNASAVKCDGCHQFDPGMHVSFLLQDSMLFPVSQLSLGAVRIYSERRRQLTFIKIIFSSDIFVVTHEPGVSIKYGDTCY